MSLNKSKILPNESEVTRLKPIEDPVGPNITEATTDSEDDILNFDLETSKDLAALDIDNQSPSEISPAQKPLDLQSISRSTMSALTKLGNERQPILTLIENLNWAIRTSNNPRYLEVRMKPNYGTSDAIATLKPKLDAVNITGSCETIPSFLYA